MSRNSCYQQLVSYIKTCKKAESTYNEYIKSSRPSENIILQDQVDLIWDLKSVQHQKLQDQCPHLYDFTRAVKRWCPVSYLENAFPKR